MKLGTAKLRLTILFILMLAVPIAKAAVISIDADSLDEKYTFTFGGFGFLQIFDENLDTVIGPITSATATFDDGVELFFAGDLPEVSSVTAFSRTVYWVDPNSPTLVDQSLSFTMSGASDIAGAFYADDKSTSIGNRFLPSDALPGDIIVERLSGSQNPFLYFNGDLAIEVLSDSPVSQPSPVPLPAAFWLFGAAMIGLGGISKRSTY